MDRNTQLVYLDEVLDHLEDLLSEVRSMKMDHQDFSSSSANTDDYIEGAVHALVWVERSIKAKMYSVKGEKARLVG